MTIDDGTAIVLAYVLVSMGVIIAFLLAVFVIGPRNGRACAMSSMHPEPAPKIDESGSPDIAGRQGRSDGDPE
jgi:hypothetical protein